MDGERPYGSDYYVADFSRRGTVPYYTLRRRIDNSPRQPPTLANKAIVAVALCCITPPICWPALWAAALRLR